MTKVKEIKLEDDRVDPEGGFRDSRRGMKLVQAPNAARRVMAFNIDVEENVFSPRVGKNGRAISNSTDGIKFNVDTKPGYDRRVPHRFRTLAIAGIFLAAGVLGFLVGRRRD